MFLSDLWPLNSSIILFVIAGAVIGAVGTGLSRQADRLADITGLGEAVTGAVFLGATTSLPGITASLTAAANGEPTLAISNAIGGIAAQTAFLAIADMTYRRANLEHAAASVPNMMLGALLIGLLSLLLIAMAVPAYTFWNIHPVTILLCIGYLLGIRLVYQSYQTPMWRPRMTRDTRVDTPDALRAAGRPLIISWLTFFSSAAVVIAAGWVATRSAQSIILHTELSDSLVGGVLLAVTTSLPELVTSIAAVRQGALTLAVGGILGGNAFDTLFAAGADIVYREGSVYHRVTDAEVSLVAMTILMSSVLLLGLLRRQKSGIGNIGFESFLVIILYVICIILLSFS